MTVFNGILPALVTPFDREGRFDACAFDQLLEHVYAADVHGIYVNGSTGEGLLQSAAQRKQVAEVAIANSPPGKQVIIHVGAASTADAIELARHAAHAGAHAISSLLPPGSYSFDEIKAYYETLAAASGVPLLVYHFPAINASIISAAQLLELCRIPGVVGLKFTDYDLFTLATVKASGAIVFNGYDQVLVAGLLMGADGGIGTIYNLVPELFVQIYELSQGGRWAEARRVQERINELIRIIVRYPVFPATKAILSWAGIDCGRCLAPRRSLTATEETQLRDELATSSFAERLLAGEKRRGEAAHTIGASSDWDV
ncbi:MAG: dihydrodipicolinate synthase family protein [Pyrinomonadaceae bacterium]|nr:dihydrodipicolinate synthase family protein [Pyrinomonadaceae bacterium]